MDRCSTVDAVVKNSNAKLPLALGYGVSAKVLASHTYDYELLWVRVMELSIVSMYP